MSLLHIRNDDSSETRIKLDNSLFKARVEEASHLKSHEVPIHFFCMWVILKKKQKKRPHVFLCPCCRSSMQHLGGSHKHCGLVLCSVSKVDHRRGNGSRLPCSLCQHWGVMAQLCHCLKVLLTAQTAAFALQGLGGQNPSCLLPMPSPQCNCSMKTTVQPLCIWGLGPSSVFQPWHFTW